MSHVACTPYERLNFTGLWKDECNREEARKIWTNNQKNVMSQEKIMSWKRQTEPFFETREEYGAEQCQPLS